MWRTLNNLISYLWFVFSLDLFQLVSTIIDVIILCWAFANWKEVAFQPSLLLIFFGVFINFIWQTFNVAGHFSFLRKENPRDPLMSMLKKSRDDKKDFSMIRVDQELLLKKDYPYVIDTDLGVLMNPQIVELLRDSRNEIIPVKSKNKRKETRTYVRQYKDTLLKFLNHRWYEVCQKGGQYTNDEKICFASEIYPGPVHGSYKWRVTKGYYYYGYLTNFIYTQYVGGTHYKLYPPVNMSTDPIKSLGDSDFSDHIGVSTLLYTCDGYIFVFRQAGNAGYNANYFMPTGSGSMDYADFKEGEDLREMIIRGAERELAEESSLKKLMGNEVFASHLHTTVIGYYRDMERGGKPEFCCVSRIKKTKEDVREYIRTSDKEIAKNSKEPLLLTDKEKWRNKILPEASLSLKMNYKFLEEIESVKGTGTTDTGV